MSEVTADGKILIQAWLAAQERVARLTTQVQEARKDVGTAEVALAKWLMPEDARPGEKIAVWFGDSLIQVEVGGVVSRNQGGGPDCVSPTQVTIRKRGPKL